VPSHTIPLLMLAPAPSRFPAEFRYDTDDPYAISIHFDSCGEDLTWTFARDILVQAMDEAAGLGDVRAWPVRCRRGRDVIMLALSNSEEEEYDVLFEIPREPVARFLRHTFLAVPRGEESAHIDLDSVVNALLAEEGT
jgi:hypothetical protein